MNDLIDDVVLVLMDGIKIKMTDGLREPYNQLVSGGYADWYDGFVRKNWKTSYWHVNLVKEQWYEV